MGETYKGRGSTREDTRPQVLRLTGGAPGLGRRRGCSVGLQAVEGLGTPPPPWLSLFIEESGREGSLADEGINTLLGARQVGLGVQLFWQLSEMPAPQHTGHSEPWGMAVLPAMGKGYCELGRYLSQRAHCADNPQGSPASLCNDSAGCASPVTCDWMQGWWDEGS